MVDYDDILKNVVGEFGAYQKRCCFLLALVHITLAFRVIAPVFLQAEPDHWCKVPESALLIETCQSLNISEDCANTVKHLTIPKERSTQACHTDWKFSNCFRYDNVSGVDFLADSLNISSAIISCDQGWEYDMSQYKSTVTQEFNLVCDRHYQSALLTSIYIAGLVFGNVIYGPLSDRIGRMKTFVICLAQNLVYSAIEIFAPIFLVSAIARFAVATANIGMHLTTFVLISECVGPSKRTAVGILCFVMYSCGYMGLACLAYLIRDWRYLLLAICLPVLPFITYWWIIPESARWLLAVGKIKEAEDIIRKTARVNGVSLPDEMLVSLRSELADDATKENAEKTNIKTSKVGILDIFRYPNIRKKTLILFFCGFTTSLTYYGFVYGVSNMHGNVYVNVAVAGAVEIPTNFLTLVLMDSKLGRRFTFFGASIVTALASIGTTLVPKCGDVIWVGTALNMVGKSAAAALYSTIYIYAAELYPTTVRSLGYSAVTLVTLSGGVMAPQVLLAQSLWTPLPMIVFAVMATVAGLLVLLLPETRGKKLEQTIEEGETGGTKKRRRAKHSHNSLKMHKRSVGND